MFSEKKTNELKETHTMTGRLEVAIVTTPAKPEQNCAGFAGKILKSFPNNSTNQPDFRST